VAAIAGLEPDLVVVNDEENRWEDVEHLRAAGLALHEMSPRSVADVGPALAILAGAVGAGVPRPFSHWDGWLEEERRRHRGAAGRRVFVPVWRRPWMTMAGDTYGSSLLDLLGYDNVFAGDPARYPSITLAEAAARSPDVVLLPSEPYPFGARHRPEVTQGIPAARVVLVDGQDLFWWGIRTPAAVRRLDEALHAALSQGP
jgi:ABC-type Fe3+-hydroxamate transport system substrate-binding protein